MPILFSPAVQTGGKLIAKKYKSTLFFFGAIAQVPPEGASSTTSGTRTTGWEPLL